MSTARPTSWPCPIAFDDAPAVRELQALTGNADAAVYAIRLWQQRRRVGPFVASAGALVRIATQGRARKNLAEHLVAAGIVVADPSTAGAFLIRPWEETAFVDWTRAGAVDEEPPAPEDKEERARRLARERAARHRTTKRTVTPASRSKRDASVTPKRDASRSERDGSVTERDDSGVKGASSARAHVRDGDGNDHSAASAAVPKRDAERDLFVPKATSVTPVTPVTPPAPPPSRELTDEQRDANAYFARYNELYPAAKVTRWGKAWHAWVAARKHRSLAELLRSLDALALRGRTTGGEEAALGLGASLSEAWVSKGLLLAASPTPQRSARNAPYSDALYDEMERASGVRP